MSGFGVTPVSTAILATNQFPAPAVAVPNTPAGDLTALEGGPASTDTNGNQTAPVSVYIKDGGNVAQGKTTDAANANTVIGQLKQVTTNTNPFTSLLADQTNTEMRVSLYGKNTTAGDTALLVDALGQMTVEDFIRYQIMQGHGFRATTGLVATGTGSNNFICMQAAVNAILKRVLVYSILVSNTNLTGEIRLYTSTAAAADTTLTTNLTALNQQPHSATTSVLTTLVGSPASTTQTSGFQGTQGATYAAGTDSVIQLLSPPSLVYFAAGDTGSVEVANKIPGTGNSAAITMEWIEF